MIIKALGPPDTVSIYIRDEENNHLMEFYSKLPWEEATGHKSISS